MQSGVKNWWQFLPILVVLSLVSPVFVAFRDLSQPTPPFNIIVTYHTKDANTGESVDDGPFLLNVSVDGKVCSPDDNGQWHTLDRGNGFTHSARSTCAGNFDQGGNLSYTKIVTDDVYNFGGLFTCTAIPYSIPYTGKFDPTSNSFAGTIGKVKTTLICPGGSNVSWDVIGLWTGQIA